MRKFLFIGVGGSGGKTLRFLSDAIKKRLAEAGYSGPLPDAWQFVQFDLPPNDDGMGDRLPETLGAAYHGFAPSGVNYDHHLRQLAGKGDEALLEDLSTWWPNPTDAPKNPWFGAGQYRAVGRLITLNRLSEIRSAVDGAVTAMELESATKNFDEIAGLLGFDVGGALNESIAIVIGSMAGGTGSGALLDVCDLLRIMGHHGRTFLQMPFGVLYTAGIFAATGGGAMPGIEPNSLAFASEVSGLLKQEISDSPVYHSASGSAAVLTERGPALSFLIGRGNSNGLVLADDIEVFRSTAQALSAWVLDPGVQSLLQSSPIGNIDILGKTRSALPIHRHESEKQPMSSFGYSKFGISRRRFHEYSAERLGRIVVDHLLTAHRSIAGDDVAPRAAVEQVASVQRLTQFLILCKINERLGTDNDIIDAIRAIAEREMGTGEGGVDLRTDLQSQASEVVDKVLNSAAASARGFTEATGNSMLNREATEKAKYVVPKWENAFRAAGSKWLDDIKPQILNGVVETMATVGLPVTVELVRKANADLEQAIAALQAEAAFYAGKSREAFVNLPVEGKGGRARVQGLLNRLRAIYLDPVKHFLGNDIEARLRRESIEAIKLLRSSFMTPLVGALASAEVRLKDEWSIAKDWAAGSSVPGDYKPDPNVVLLLDPEDYPSTFESLLAKTVGGSGSITIEHAVKAVLQAGEDQSSGRNARGIRPFITASALTAATGRAEISIASSADEIRDRCWRWLKSDPTTGIGEFITSSLRDTLRDASKNDIDRFVAKFRMALDRSAPLVEINPATMNTVHQIPSPEYQRVMSLIPLEPDEGDKAFVAVRDLLLSYDGFDAASIAGMFGRNLADGSDAGDIEISTFMRAYHPMVFASLMTPIATAAQTAMGKGDMGFWTMRRSRPLTEFVPLSNRTQTYLARGWIVASVLGQVNFESATVFGHSYVAAKLASPEGWLTFVTPGLGRLASQKRDVFAVVMESYALAEALAATGQADRLRPYERLLDLGSSTILQDWISTGALDAGSLPHLDDREARVAHVLTMLESARSRLSEYDEEFQPSIGGWSLPPRGKEVRSLIAAAIDDLLKTVTAEDMSSDGEFVIQI
jgi:hypothetical protein